MDKNEKETFSYTYSADWQKEVKRIREKYIPKEANPMEQLLKLDQSVTQKATVSSLIWGVMGTLILGLGMSCTMVGEKELFLPGIVIGLIGIWLVTAAYPIYLHTLKKERQKIAAEIMRLTDELLK